MKYMQKSSTSSRPNKQRRPPFKYRLKPTARKSNKRYDTFKIKGPARFETSGFQRGLSGWLSEGIKALTTQPSRTLDAAWAGQVSRALVCATPYGYVMNTVCTVYTAQRGGPITPRSSIMTRGVPTGDRYSIHADGCKYVQQTGSPPPPPSHDIQIRVKPSSLSPL